jgi:hypothetical protein
MEAVWFFKILATIITVYGVITQMIAVWLFTNAKNLKFELHTSVSLM